MSGEGVLEVNTFLNARRQNIFHGADGFFLIGGNPVYKQVIRTGGIPLSSLGT